MAILDLKEKIEPFRKNATGYVKQLLSANHVVMSDGTTLQTKMDSLNSTLAGAICIKTYSMTLTANNYVQPFSMFGDGIIPDADIKKYGSPIAICAIQKSSAPGAAALRWNIGRSAWQYIACSNTAETDVNITFMKLS